MRFLLSLKVDTNIEPIEWINFWLGGENDGQIDGFEIYSTSYDKKEREFIKLLANEMKKKKLILQFHGLLLEKTLEDMEIIKFYDEIASISGYSTKVVFHPYDKAGTTKGNIKKSDTLFKKLTREINKHDYKIVPTVENLNTLKGNRRPRLNDITTLIEKIDELFLNWDVGHDVFDNVCEYKLNKLQKNKLKSIHIHDVKGNEDHHPFYYEKTDKNKIMNYLRKIDYKETIVLEVALNYLKENEKPKMRDELIRQIKALKECIYEN